MPGELCQVSPKSHYVVLALHSDPSPFNSFSKKKTLKMSENGEIYTAGKNFTLPPALTGWTNSTSVY